MSIEKVKAALNNLSGFAQVANGVRFNTQCLYPNNGHVRLLVMGEGETFIVTDEGGAFKEAIEAGANPEYKDIRFQRALKQQGLSMRAGAINSPKVSLEALPSAIALVANASKETAEWIFEHWRLERTRKFKSLLRQLLKDEFHVKALQEQNITGESNKPHTFESVIQFMNGSRLLVDAVVKDSNSINARVVANLDVKGAGHPHLLQTIVYDDEDEVWGAADLKLLGVSGVPIIPFSKSVEGLRSLVGGRNAAAKA